MEKIDLFHRALKRWSKTSHTISILSTIGMISNAKLVPNGRNTTQIDKYCPQLFRVELPQSGSCFALQLVLPLFIQCSKLLIGKMCVSVCMCVCVLAAQSFFATPWTVALQAPWCMGFPRQEYWSGLPFPSPMHESEKWKWSRSVVSNSSRPHGPQPTRLLCPWDFPGKSIGVGCHRLLRWSAC